jgi:hypothetical protein
MPKNIALFIDGTWNEPRWGWHTTNTNVRQLFTAAQNQPDQICHYLRGIGTDRPQFQFLDPFRKFLIRNLVGGAFGFGMSDRIKDAYKFLSEYYEPNDHVYLFGFSRGAFAARSIAGFVDAVGLLLKKYAGDHNLIESAYGLYENGQDGKHSALSGFLRELGFTRPPSAEDGTNLPIYFIGVWDTVATLGLSGRLARFSAPFTEFHQTQVPKTVSYARHALALHELRKKFPALLWYDSRSPDSKGRPRVQQMWFPGAHSNVGGGYPNTQWSDTALDWMAGEAREFGLKLRAWPRTPPQPCPRAMIDNSLTGIFAASPPVQRASLLDPNVIDRDTLLTFDVHPFAARRLFDDQHTRYPYASHVSDALSAADWSTVRMIHTLCGSGRTDGAVKASLVALDPTRRDRDDCCTALRSFADATPVTTRGCDALLRTFMFSRFLEKPPVVAAELDRLVREFIAGLPGTPDLGTVKAAVNRLARLVGTVRDITGELNSTSAPQLPNSRLPNPLHMCLERVESRVASLNAHVKQERLRRSAPPPHQLRPRPRGKPEEGG